MVGVLERVSSTWQARSWFGKSGWSEAGNKSRCIQVARWRPNICRLLIEAWRESSWSPSRPSPSVSYSLTVQSSATDTHSSILKFNLCAARFDIRFCWGDFNHNSIPWSSQDHPPAVISLLSSTLKGCETNVLEVGVAGFANNQDRARSSLHLNPQSHPTSCRSGHSQHLRRRSSLRLQPLHQQSPRLHRCLVSLPGL